MKGFDKDWYEQDKLKRDRVRPGAIVQKLKDDLRPKADQSQPVERPAIPNNQPKEERLHGEGHKPVRVSITWLVSDKRRRDAWGMAETIADCIVAAFRRLASPHAAGTTKRKIRK